jgi:hypothetical protein
MSLCASNLRSPRRQRGVVLFVALIAMLLLSLAGIALMRSVDTNMGVAGNLGFRQATIAPVNEAIDESVRIMFKTAAVPIKTADFPSQNYFAQIQAGESRNGVPALLQGDYNAMKTAYSAIVTTAPITDSVTDIEMRWIIERLCNSQATNAELTGHCDTLPPKVSRAGTDNTCVTDPAYCLTLPPIPVYRITVRADIPTTNSVSFAQAFVK